MSQNNNNNNNPIKNYIDFFNIIVANIKTINNIFQKLNDAIGNVDIEIPDNYTIIMKGQKMRIVIEMNDPNLMPIMMDIIFQSSFLEYITVRVAVGMDQGYASEPFNPHF